MSRAPTAREDEIQAASSSHVGSWCGKTSAPRRSSHPALVAWRVAPSVRRRSCLGGRPCTTGRRVASESRVGWSICCDAQHRRRCTQLSRRRINQWWKAARVLIVARAASVPLSLARPRMHARRSSRGSVSRSSHRQVILWCLHVYLSSLSVYIASSSMSSFSTNVSRGGHEHTCATWTARARVHVRVPHLAHARAMLWCARAPGCGRRKCR